MKNHFTVIFILLFASVHSQELLSSISGTVKDDYNNPLAFATVMIEGLKLGVLTDDNGSFLIENVPQGKHNVVVSFIGYRTLFKTVEITSSKKKITVNYKLTESVENLDEVNVNGKSKETEIETKGFAVNAIKTEEASIRNIQTNELLNTTVGVKIRQNGGLGSNVEYSLNGLSGNSVSIFIDGIPISMYGSSFSLNSIPPSMIENIEVYKGVIPGHLADDALGGAINIVMKKGARNNLNASVSYGSFNTLQASINGLYRFDKSGFTVKASGFHNYSDNDYEISGRNIVDKGLGGVETLITAKRFNDAYRSTGGTIQAGYTDVKWADQFFIGVTGSDDYKEVQHGAFVTKIPYKGRFLESDALLANLTYLKKDIFFKGLDVNVTGSFGERNRILNDTTAEAYSWTGNRAIDYKGDEFEYSWGSQQEGGPTLLNINRKVASIRTGISYEINKNHKVFLNHVYSGLDREDSDEMISLLENTFQQTSDIYKNIYSLSYELNAIDDKLKVNLFGKHYRQKVLNTFPRFNSNATEVIDEVYQSNKDYNGYGYAISYLLIKNLNILTSAEKAIRLPNENEVFGDAGENIEPNLTIEPETSNNYNLGFRFGRFNIKNHALTVSTNLFSRKIQNLIGFPGDAQDNQELGETIQYGNFDRETISKGVEAEISYNFKNNFGFNFNLSKLTLQRKNLQDNIVNSPNVPLFTMNTSLRYSFNNFIQNTARFNLFYNAYFTDEFSYKEEQGTNVAGLEEFLIPTQFIQDFGCSYVFPNKRVSISLDVKNVFDEVAYDNLRVQKPGRAFYLKLNYIINNF
ncbi:Outer membrane receptor proteins, mostly Fe transport [Maribacter dokdonensis]|uniref:Outer membrane receptor proteins, mostly Fe transport n=2 Tax=Maribacter TaxID=252356 RepID=A0A1H4PWP1_9FLAO|nr:TonB-dependent receptor [Maribacter dokdonensis]SEC11819.1 Outer membrane receptor proteins, mostly Fe transport [Maribacter dokdonensis]